MDKQPPLFDRLPIDNRYDVRVPRIDVPVWTRNKARLIESYLNLFVMITHHGVYIDGFAGPQRPGDDDAWAAKLVLDSEPRRLRNFLLVDANRNRAAALRDLKAKQPRSRDRTVYIWHGDFNSLVDDVLAASLIKERTASFCLLDQRTFECHWETVRKISQYKRGYKIEIFYFFGSSWFDRALSGLNEEKKALDWWGRCDLDEFRNRNRGERPQILAGRFKSELGYANAMPWPIFDENRRIMYHMIHATDHPEAPKLMARAYKKATSSVVYEQLNLDHLLRDRPPDDG